MALQTQICPPLENGDRLSYREFERRYAAMPQHQKAELGLAEKDEQGEF